MLAIYRKEIRYFFSSATGYIVIGVFLLLTSLFLWLIPGSFNVLDSGYANVEGLFYLAPWLFLLLIPALTMRSVAEERQSGSWDILRSKPLKPTQIILGKYLAALSMALLALLPTLVYYFSVRFIAQPQGNVDSGQFWGSFAGLFLLAAVYSAVGIFASSLSRNQITAFIIALLLSFTLYYGFDLLSSFFSGGSQIVFLENLGIHAHYKSISRGVIDSRDLLYYIVVTAVFLGLSVGRVGKK